MLRHERRLLFDCLGIGVALTMLVIAADGYRLLNQLEDALYDLRARTCQHFMPTPTDTLVHIDIDDPALDTLGWPLPRATVGKILDEVRLAGAKAVELDVLFDQPQKVQFEEVVVHAATQPATQPATQATTTSASQPVSQSPQSPPKALGGLSFAPPESPATQPTTTATSATTAPAAPATQRVEYTRTDHDAELAAAIRRLDNVIVPATFQPVPRYSPIVAAMIEELRKDPELEPEPLAAVLRQRGDVKVPDGGLGELFFVARREAFEIRLRELNLGPDTPFEAVRARLLPRTPIEINTGAANVLRDQWTKYLAVREFRRFAWPRPRGMAAYGSMRVAIAPVRQLSAAAGGGAFVDYTQFGSPVIRELPLLLEVEGHVYPQMGLSLACRMLDADVTRLRVDPGGGVRDGAALIVPRRGAGQPDVRIPLAPPRVSSSGALYGHRMSIPWFGGPQWEHMYDWPAQRTSKQHVPMTQVWQAAYARDKLVRNNQSIDAAVRSLYASQEDAARIEKYDGSLPPVDDFAAREKFVRALLEEFAPFLEQYKELKPHELRQEDHWFLESVKALNQLLELSPPIIGELAASRAGLRSQIEGKAVLVGWSATGAIADFVPTSLHEKCPGAVVHGVVYNGIMTGEMWRTAPWWTVALATLLLGTTVAFATARFSPVKALLIALALAGLFAIFNGTILFDRYNTIFSAAAPLFAIGCVWAACTLTRVIIEAAERNRITRRFSNYVDPKIVDYVMENPQVTFDGETREMTVVFTDLAGFTAISEKLGEKVVPLLNELFGELVPVIRKHNGTLNKFLGDGIMFFFNAPRNMPSHAAVAVKAVLEMHDKVAEFNQRLRGQDVPELAMRAGVMTAEMIVGDAGGAGAADYTVLGDAVNTGSRLEAANKQTGTSTLISARTAAMLDGEFLVRPIGKLKVVGKDEAVMVYEPLAPTSRASDGQRELAKCSAELVESYVQRRFDDTLALAGLLENRFGKSKLAALYRALAKQYLDTPPTDDFDGRIVLTEK